MPASLHAALNDLARHKGVNLRTLLLAAFQVLLYRCTGQEDILVGRARHGPHFFQVRKE